MKNLFQTEHRVAAVHSLAALHTGGRILHQRKAALRTPFCRLLSMAAKFFLFTLQRTIFSQNAGIEMRNFQKICAPAFAKAGARCICGYEI